MDEDVLIQGTPQASYLGALRSRSRASGHGKHYTASPASIDDEALNKEAAGAVRPQQSSSRPSQMARIKAWVLKHLLPVRNNLFDTIDHTKRTSTNHLPDPEEHYVRTYLQIISAASPCILHPDESPFFDKNVDSKSDLQLYDSAELQPPVPKRFPWKTCLKESYVLLALILIVQLLFMLLEHPWTRFVKLLYFIASTTTLVLLGAKVFSFWILHQDEIRHDLNVVELKNFIVLCSRFNTAIRRSINFIQEIELVSRGYRLSSPLSPVTRLEQDAKTKKCAELRNTVYSVLSAACEVLRKQDVYKYWRPNIERDALGDKINAIDQAIQQLQGETDTRQSDASTASTGDSKPESATDNSTTNKEPSILVLKKLAEKMSLLRSHFISNTLVACGCHSVRRVSQGPRGEADEQVTYMVRTAVIRSLIDLLASVAIPLEQLVEELETALQEEISLAKKIEAKSSGTKGKSEIAFVAHHLARLLDQCNTIQSRVQLCAQDLAAYARTQNPSDNNVTQEALEELSKHYDKLLSDVSDFQAIHKAGKSSLQKLLASRQLSSGSIEAKPLDNQPHEQEIAHDNDESELVEDSEQNRADIAATFAAQLEHVYEAFVAETQDNVSETRIRPALKSREERIAEQRKKRAEEAQRNETFERLAVVSELKDVLATKSKTVVPVTR